MQNSRSLRNVRVVIFAIVVATTGSITDLRSWGARQINGVSRTSSSGDSENGKRIFKSVGCWECHGFIGQGGEAGARIGRTSLALPVFLDYIRHPKGQMPPYEVKAISDTDLTDIYAFLQSVPKPTPAKDIPLLNIELPK